MSKDTSGTDRIRTQNLSQTSKGKMDKYGNILQFKIVQIKLVKSFRTGIMIKVIRLIEITEMG